MPIPMERELLRKQSEKITPLLLERFRAANLRRAREKDVELFTTTFDREMLRANIKTWYPGNYREDLKADERAGEGRGFPGELR